MLCSSRVGHWPTLSLLGLLLLIALLVLDTPRIEAQSLSTDATLDSLTLNDGTVDVALFPTFSSSTTSYWAAVKYRGRFITVTASPTDSGADVDILDVYDTPLGDADGVAPGFQVQVPLGGLTIKVKVTAEDNMNEEVYEVVVERDTAWLFGWTPTRDINTLQDAGNDDPTGIWSDGTTIWVADDDDDKLFAYTLATGARSSGSDISLHSDNADAAGIWSDGTTIWVADDGEDKLFAYTLATGARSSGSDITLDSTNADAAGIWSDGTTIWVANNSGSPRKIFAYTLTSGARDTAKEFTPSWNAAGIWASGSTMWVVSVISPSKYRMEAYALDLLEDGSAGPNHGQLLGQRFDPVRGFLGGTTPVGIWSDNKGGLWLAEPDSARVESYHIVPYSAGGTTLKTLAVNDGTTDARLRPALQYGHTSYRAAVPAVPRVTVRAVPDENTSDVIVLPGDADLNTPGHQVELEEGPTSIEVLVTAADGTAFLYSLEVERDSSRFGGRTPTKDIYDLDPLNNTYPTDLWSDGTTMWVANPNSGELFAYSLATGARDTDKEFTLDAANTSPAGIWSDGTTLWVYTRSAKKLFAYALEDGTRQDGTGGTTNKDITLSGDTNSPGGIWSDGTTLYVLESDGTLVQAYSMADGTRQDGTGDTTNLEIDVSALTLPNGIWGDGTTLWIAAGNRAYAFTLSTGARDESKDINLVLSYPRGIWSDGTTMWISDQSFVTLGYSTSFHRVFAYRLPPLSPGETTLSNLSVAPSPAIPSFTATLRPDFSYSVDSFRVAVPNSAQRVTVMATGHDSAATVTYLDNNGFAHVDADGNTSGLQVAVAVGTTVINVRVTKSGAVATTYTVVVERDSAEFGGWTPTKDFNDLGDLTDEIRGVWSDGTTFYVLPKTTPTIYAYAFATGARDDTKDISISQGSITTAGLWGWAAGLWSDETTLWVLNYGLGHNDDGEVDYDEAGSLFAYTLDTGTRDTTKEFNLGPRYSYFGSRGVWSDGTTVWVSSWDELQLAAYTLASGTRDYTKSIYLFWQNAGAQGIWSDGTTIWVADSDDLKVYAYTLTPGASFGDRDTSKEFNLAPEHRIPRGAWSDGTHLWLAADTGDSHQKFYSYLLDDPASRVLVIDPVELDVEEGGSSSFTVKLASPPTGDVTVTVTSGDPSAATVNPASLTFTTTNWNVERTVTVEGVDDVDTEDEVVTVSLSASGGGYSGRTGTVTVSTNDDAAISVHFGAASYSATEGGANATVQVELTQAPTSAITIPLVASPRDGATASDYMGIPQSLTFGVGEQLKTFIVVATDDDDNDDFEAVQIFFDTLPPGVKAAEPSDTIVLLTDNEASVRFGSSTYTAAEAGPAATILVSLDDPATETLTITLNVTPLGGATASDYTISPLTLTFLAGEQTKTVTVAAVDDTENDDGESILLGFGALPPGYRSAPPATATVYLTDDEPSFPVVTVESASAVEGDDIVFTVRMSPPADPGQWVALYYGVGDLTATSGVNLRDYTPPSPAHIQIGYGASSVEIRIPTIDDNRDEADETLRIRLFSGTGYYLGTPHEAIGTIIDNDDSSPVDTVPGDTSTNASVSVTGGPFTGAVTGAIEHINDEDWYRATFQAGQCYLIEVRGSQDYEWATPNGLSLTLSDPFLMGVYDASGRYIRGTQIDDGGVSNDASIMLRFSESGTYYIAVSHGWFDQGGTYEVDVTRMRIASIHCKSV